ncbi:hypothetical protein Pcinc_043757 [Petrolisthes cinctipes]|uniref:Uncharacterized protein n=1 Tax=Petrolisthes cinctipes TaxID=88211 RepID=A0AAE1EFZ4_PETCI|nr:hypothetical protein Pcinc_043757 [Petrolisthes cinctipes]
MSSGTTMKVMNIMYPIVVPPPPCRIHVYRLQCRHNKGDEGGGQHRSQCLKNPTQQLGTHWVEACSLTLGIMLVVLVYHVSLLLCRNKQRDGLEDGGGIAGRVGHTSPSLPECGGGGHFNLPSCITECCPGPGGGGVGG